MASKVHDSRLSKVMLAVGFLALLGGTLAAFRTPARGYELSIYAATPLAFWFGVAIAIAVSLAVSFGERGPSVPRDLGLLLGVAAVADVVALPLVRGYYHFGGGDAMTHLGWTRDIVAGRLEPVNMLYPGIHTSTIFVSNVVGAGYSNSQMFVVLAYFLLFVAFITLCVRMLGRTEWAVPVGLFSALLVLPNNNVSVHLMAHPITQSLLALPLILYLVMKYVRRTGESTNRLYVATPIGVILALACIALVLIHPQGALNIVGILVAITVVQFFFRRFRSHSSIDSHRPVYVPTAIAITAFAVWAPRHERVQNTFQYVTESVLTGAVPADEIAQRSASLSVLGGSIEALFAKLFLVSVLFCLLAGALIAAWYLGRLDDSFTERNALITYLVVALVPLTVAFGAFFASSMTTQHFRYVGFIMVPITILGAVALSEGARSLGSRATPQTSRASLAVCFLLLLALPIASIHTSPFIYQASGGVSAQEMQGAETTFAEMDRDIAFAGIRGGPDRLLHATYGPEQAASMNVSGFGPASNIPGPVFDSNLTTHYEADRYIPVARSDVQREAELYDGFRYSKRGFDRLDTSPKINRVHSTGEYRLYLLEGTASE